MTRELLTEAVLTSKKNKTLMFECYNLLAPME
jgi:hypothetical protein